MSDRFLILIILGVPVIGFLTWLFFKDSFNQIEGWKGALMKAAVYSFFFGISMTGEGGGEPGFILPVTVGSALVIELNDENFHLLIRNVLLPHILWTSIFLLYYCLKYWFIRFKKSNWRTRPEKKINSPSKDSSSQIFK